MQYEGYLRREEANTVIRDLVGEGVSIKEIVRRTGHSRKLVRSVVRGQRTDIFRVRQTSLEPHLPWLEAQWMRDCETALNFGGSFGWLGLAEASALSRNGQHDEGGRKRPRTESATRPQHAPSSV